MGLTIAVKTVDVVGQKTRITGTITFDNSYPTSGEAITAADLGLTRLDDLLCGPGLVNAYYVHSSGKLIAYYPGEQPFRIPITMETGAAGVFSFKAPFACTLVDSFLVLEDCGSSGNTTIDVANGATTAYTTVPTVANDATNGFAGGDAGTINAAADDFAADAEIRITVAIATGALGIAFWAKFVPQASPTGLLVQVANTTDLSTLVIPFEAVGIGLRTL